MLKDIEQLLKKKIGLDVEAVGMATISCAVELRKRKCEALTVEAYWAILIAQEDELQALVEAVIVPETWFFRDPQAFFTLAALLGQGLRGRLDGRPFRILSLPCSTGEEPYTIAMALMEAEIIPSRYHITGVDISWDNLKRAKSGEYGAHSFRGSNLQYRDKYFTKNGSEYVVQDNVRASIDFEQGNIFTLNSDQEDHYDVIFCRNLLIYFDENDQRRALRILHKWLAPHGVLFVGHSEVRVVASEGFKALRIPHAFAFQKAFTERDVPSINDVISVNCVASLSSKNIRQSRLTVPRHPVDRTSQLRDLSKTKIDISSADNAASIIQNMKDLANQGAFEAAIDAVNVLLKAYTPNAEMILLMGVLYEAIGNMKQAATYYRKALYLDPSNYDTLIHLAILQEQVGVMAEAQKLRARATRLQAE